MARRPRTLVLDSWAVLAYLEDEPAAGQVSDILLNAHEHGTQLLMTTVNAGELWYILSREVSDSEAERAIAELSRFGIRLVDADWALTRVAAGFKARFRMSYADCFAAALAKVEKAELVTGDREFVQVEGDIGINWLESRKIRA